MGPDDVGNESDFNEDVGLESQPVEAETVETPPSDGINPAWNDLLGALPTSLHSQAIPHLRKWDEGVQNRFQQVQSQYAPYKSIIEAGVNPDEVMASVQLAQMIANDPRAFYDRMGAHYGEQWGLNNPSDQGQESDDADDYSLDEFDDDDLANNPLLQQIQQQQELLANVVATQLQERQAAEQQQIAAEADAKLEQDIAGITETYGEIDPQTMKIILSVAVNDPENDIAKAAELVMGRIGQAPKPSAPVMSPGGGVPSNNVDPASLDSKGTRSLVMQILANAKAAENG